MIMLVMKLDCTFALAVLGITYKFRIQPPRQANRCVVQISRNDSPDTPPFKVESLVGSGIGDRRSEIGDQRSGISSSVQLSRKVASKATIAAAT